MTMTMTIQFLQFLKTFVFKNERRIRNFEIYLETNDFKAMSSEIHARLRIRYMKPRQMFLDSSIFSRHAQWRWHWFEQVQCIIKMMCSLRSKRNVIIIKTACVAYVRRNIHKDHF